MKKIIVIGGGAAGCKAASKAKREDKDNIVELYTNENNIAYSLCGLPYFIEGTVKDINSLIVRTPKDFENNGIKVFLNHQAKEIFPEEKKVLINNDYVTYDKLILALGAHVNIPNIVNFGATNVFTLRSLDDAIQIRNKMLQSKTVLIVGAGYIAIELTEAFIANGLDVIVVENKDGFVGDFDPDFSRLITDLIKSKSNDKLKTYFNKNIVRFNVDEENVFQSVVTEDNEEIFADFCVLSTGAKPNTIVAKSCGIQIGATGAIYVDSKMRTNIKDIYAAGDCVQKYSIITKKPTYLGLGTIANKEGRVAAINAVGVNSEVFDGVLDSVVTRFFNYTISKTGLTMENAKELSKEINIEPIETTITKNDKASYMPNSNKVTIKLVADKRNGELLGAQAIGYAGNIAKRINTIVAAIKNRMTVEEILHLDLPYAPPVSGSIDPILTAAYKLKDLLK